MKTLLPLLDFLAAYPGPEPPGRPTRVELIGEFWGHPKTRTFGELLIDLEEDKAARAVVFELLVEIERR